MMHNEEDWLVPLPYAYTGKSADTTEMTSEEFSGNFEFINHGTENSSEMIETLSIDLTEDGDISGDLIGSWNLSEQNLLTISTDQGTYKGVIAKQQDELGEERIVFSAFGDTNEMIWGIRP